MSEPGSLTRRRLFGAAAVAGGAALLDRGGLPALARAAGRGASAGEPPRIAIVGAGLAGLSCAYRLGQHGLPSTLYEAHQERIGGRCWTAREFAAGQTAEHGGEFIDSSHRRIRALAAELGLTLDDLAATAGHMPRLHPRLVLGGRVRRFRDVYRDAGLLEARAAADARRIGSFQWNRAGHDARELDEMTAAEWIAQALPEPSQRLLRVATGQLMSEEYGLDPDRLSAINMLIQFGPFGPESDERFHVRGGNDLIAHGLAARLPAGALRLAHPLRAVRRDGDGYALSFADLTGEVRADVLVLCLPFTALRRVDTSGLGLTRRKRQCIEQLGMGTNAKLLLQFDRHLSDYDNWNGELYDEHVDTWNSSLGEPGRPGILTVFSGGRYGAAQTGRGPHGPAPRGRTDRALAVLENAVPGIERGWNGHAWLDHWTSDPWTHGSYAAFEPGQYSRYWGFAGRREGRVLFGGEHTAQSAQGYLEGAVRSGERCATEVMRLS